MQKLAPWLGAAVIIGGIFITIYTVTQQAQRRDANFPQIQIAEDSAAELNQGVKAEVPGKVDMAHSLSSFIIIYDLQGRVVSGSGYLNDTLPSVSFGVLTASKGKDYSAVTWQPNAKVRIAAVTVAAKNYYVLSGRSLTEVEKNETGTLQRTALGLLGALIVLAATYFISRPSRRQQVAKSQSD